MGLAPDFTNAVEITHRYSLIAQVVPVPVQVFIFRQLDLRVAGTSPSPENKARKIAQLKEAIEADEARLARNKAALERARAA